MELWSLEPDGAPRQAGIAATSSGENWDVTLTYSADGRSLAVRQREKAPAVIDVGDLYAPTLRVDLSQQLGTVSEVELGPDGRTLAMTGPSSFEVWDVKGREGFRRVVGIGKFGDPVAGWSYRPDTREAVSVSPQGWLWKFDLDAESLLGKVCARRDVDKEAVGWALHFPGVPQQELCP
ncbi:hypothetical protein ACQPZF_26610 [Actinosynnema sp. CS-041913]|uniref:hypothetical protein n=1 Tax=Actinosynnema sp. CS-041913 TaxID=3239917 RepID=UPI003D8E03C1